MKSIIRLRAAIQQGAVQRLRPKMRSNDQIKPINHRTTGIELFAK